MVCPPQEECFFDCEVSSAIAGLAVPGTPLNLFLVLSNPDCLFDCFSPEQSAPDFCITSLLREVHKKGICDRPFFATNGSTIPLYPAKEAFPTLATSQTCVTDTVSGLLVSNFTCSKTKGLLLTKPCLGALFSQPLTIQSTLGALLYLADCVPDFESLQAIFEDAFGTGSGSAASAETIAANAALTVLLAGGTAAASSPCGI